MAIGYPGVNGVKTVYTCDVSGCDSTVEVIGEGSKDVQWSYLHNWFQFMHVVTEPNFRVTVHLCCDKHAPTSFKTPPNKA